MKGIKSVILIIVEGISDEAALYSHLKTIASTFNVRFEVLNGDVFTDVRNINKSSKDIIGAVVAEFKNRRKLDDEDLLAIFQLTDTDGVFITDSNIILEATLDQRVKYTNEKIIVPNEVSQNRIRQRNGVKSKHLITLSRTKKIRKSIYQIYYFSRNIDAIIHNNADLSDNEKITAAEDFSDSLANEIEFEQFFQNQDFSVSGDYKESWDFIAQGCNSLKRYSNFHLLLESIKLLLEEHRRAG